MSGRRIAPAFRRVVHGRARGCCEYGRVPESGVLLPHEPDHIISEQHGGKPTLQNLALACFHCNRHKGPNLTSIDPGTGQIVPLFNPRNDRWSEHFRIQGFRVLPLTPTGRATAALLKFNVPERLRTRKALVQAGKYPILDNIVWRSRKPFIWWLWQRRGLRYVFPLLESAAQTSPSPPGTIERPGCGDPGCWAPGCGRRPGRPNSGGASS